MEYRREESELDGWSGIVIVDVTLALYGGLNELLKSREKGDKTLEAEVFYWTDWLKTTGSRTQKGPEQIDILSKNYLSWQMKKDQ